MPKRTSTTRRTIPTSFLPVPVPASTTADRFAVLLDELDRASGTPFELILRPVTVLALAELVAIAMKHPTMSEHRATAYGEIFLRAVGEYFHDSPSVLAALDTIKD